MMGALLVRTVLASSIALAAQVVPGPRPLAGTYWKAIELAGRPVPTQNLARVPYLMLKEGGQVYGSDGCNRVAGAWQVKGSAIRFTQMATTRMACIDVGDIDVAFNEALTRARRLSVVGATRLELFGSRSRRVAVFEAVSTPPGDSETR